MPNHDTSKLPYRIRELEAFTSLETDLGKLLGVGGVVDVKQLTDSNEECHERRRAL